MRDRVSLKSCLVEDEEGAGLRSLRRRGLALLLSILFQFAVLGALILVPLLVRGERLQATWIEPPRPIYDPGVSVPEPDPHPATGPSKRGPRPPTKGGFFQPTVIPPEVRIVRDVDEAVPDLGSEGPGIVGAIPIPRIGRVARLAPAHF